MTLPFQRVTNRRPLHAKPGAAWRRRRRRADVRTRAHRREFRREWPLIGFLTSFFPSSTERGIHGPGGVAPERLSPARASSSGAAGFLTQFRCPSGREVFALNQSQADRQCTEGDAFPWGGPLPGLAFDPVTQAYTGQASAAPSPRAPGPPMEAVTRDAGGMLVLEGIPYNSDPLSLAWRMPTMFVPDAVASPTVAKVVPALFWGLVVFLIVKFLRRR